MADSTFAYENNKPHMEYSTIIDFPLEPVWAEIRDYGNWSRWTKMFRNCKIIDCNGKDQVGCTRQFCPPTLNNVYLEVLNYRSEETHMLKYDLTKIDPPVKGMGIIHIHVCVEKVAENQSKVTETIWNEYEGETTTEFLAHIHKIQCNGALFTYKDLNDYLEEQGRKKGEEKIQESGVSPLVTI